jgi:hypothetical protein
MIDFRDLCSELADSVELLLEMRAVDAKPMAITEDRLSRARAALAQPEQDDKTLKSIRATTPRYRMSVIVSTNDSAIDTRMNVIWQALDLSKEILESVSLPEQLPPLGNQ